MPKTFTYYITYHRFRSMAYTHTYFTAPLCIPAHCDRDFLVHLFFHFFHHYPKSSFFFFRNCTYTRPLNEGMMGARDHPNDYCRCLPASAGENFPSPHVLHLFFPLSLPSDLLFILFSPNAFWISFLPSASASLPVCLFN